MATQKKIRLPEGGGDEMSPTGLMTSSNGQRSTRSGRWVSPNTLKIQ
jgi:hypothetical protein